MPIITASRVGLLGKFRFRTVSASAGCRGTANSSIKASMVINTLSNKLWPCLFSSNKRQYEIESHTILILLFVLSRTPPKTIKRIAYKCKQGNNLPLKQSSFILYMSILKTSYKNNLFFISTL